MKQGTVRGICISKKRQTPKSEVCKAEFLTDWGIENDAHAGNWHRQVSLLSYDKIEEFRKKGAEVDFGAFGENLIVEGFDFRSLPVGTKFHCNDVVLEMTQIGKECHNHCQIFKKMGDCIMPREGVFAKVLQNGTISVGDTIYMEELSGERPFRAAIITMSDSGAKGEREDKSGPVIENILIKNGYDVVETVLIGDEKEVLEKQFIRLADMRQVDLILTTGGTGFSPRDTTPEGTLAVADRLAPGIAEAMRAYSMKITNRAMLSRGVSVIRGKTLIINLPGSPKAVKESLDCILDTLPHGLEVLRGNVSNCAR